MNPQSPYPQQPGVPPALPQPYPQMPPSMKKKRGGGLNILLIILVIFFMLAFLGAGGFGLWAFGQRNDYKNNTDKKIAAAVEVAKKQESDEKEKDFLEREKNPYKEYKGPSAFGSIDILYPKTWSAYVDETRGNQPVNGYMHPSFVPGKDSETAFALRIEVLEQPYDQVLAQFNSDTKSGKVTVSPFKAAKVPSVLGARIDGEIENDLKGSMVVFPLRDKTIKISTQSEQFMNDFNNIILPNFNFQP